MGYFSNGCEGLDYQEKYCFRYRHWNDETGCPVWFLHLDKNYEWCNKPERRLLDMFIPTNDKNGNEQCTMFAEAPADGSPLFPQEASHE